MDRINSVKIRDWLNRYILAILLFLLFAISITSVVAKYVHRDQGTNLIVAKEFYFTSNLLDESDKEYILNMDANEITFTLGNNVDDLRFSEDDISYKITVEGGATLSSNEGTLENEKVSVHKITLSGLEVGKTYKVVATAEAGYKKTLQASFTVSKNKTGVYKYLDTTNDHFVLLTVWAEKIAGELTTQFPSGLIPDNTDSAMRAVKNYDSDIYMSGKFTDEDSFDEKYASRTYRFFIDKTQDFTSADFTVEIKDQESNVHLAGEAVPK